MQLGNKGMQTQAHSGNTQNTNYNWLTHTHTRALNYTHKYPLKQAEMQAQTHCSTHIHAYKCEICLSVAVCEYLLDTHT